MAPTKQFFSRFGIATKGIVYCLIGIAAALVAFDFDAETINISGAFYFIQNLIFGKILLAVIIIGLIAYGFWLGIKTFSKENYVDNKLADFAIRIGYFSGIVVYLLIAYSATLILVNSKDTKQKSIEVYKELVSTSFAQVIMITIGIGLILKAFNQFYLAISENYRKDIDESSMTSKKITWMINTGRVGYVGRGLVIATTGYLFIRGGVFHNFSEVEETDAFNWLEYELGGILMGVIALGFATYGVFFLIKGYYGDVDR